MASAGIGGVPTTTKREYTRTGPGTDVVYTCPLNTFAIVNLDYIRKYGDTDAVGVAMNLKRTLPSGTTVYTQIYSKSFTTISPQMESIATAMNLNQDALALRVDETPQLNLAGNKIGRILMYPGDQLEVARSGSSDTTVEAVFFTTEVSSNS